MERFRETCDIRDIREVYTLFKNDKKYRKFLETSIAFAKSNVIDNMYISDLLKYNDLTIFSDFFDLLKGYYYISKTLGNNSWVNFRCKNIKNCNFCVYCKDCENCNYCVYTNNSINSDNCYFCDHCYCSEKCKNCDEIFSCTRCNYCNECKNCNSCWYCYTCLFLNRAYDFVGRNYII